MSVGIIELLVAVLIGAGIVVAAETLNYYVWLYRFRRNWKSERQQWFMEHRECCELDESYLSQPYG